MQITIISGLSGAGITVALHTFEDMGYYCIDNCPIDLMLNLLQSDSIKQRNKIVIGINIRASGSGLRRLPQLIQTIKQLDHRVILLYFYAIQACLRERYNETRRKHPLSNKNTSLTQALEQEEQLMFKIRALADLVVDTTHLDIYQLADLIKRRIVEHHSVRLNLMFQSFGFKYGAPNDTDFMFDVRCLPNPYWNADLRPLTGLDDTVSQWLNSHNTVNTMVNDISTFISRWLTRFTQSQRAYLTFSIGCTGGKHRSVYITEQLCLQFKNNPLADVVAYHRDLQ